MKNKKGVILMGIVEEPKYNKNERVVFKWNDDIIEGTIFIIDSLGYFDCYMEQPSYDILGKDKHNNNTLTLFKHIPESDIVKKSNIQSKEELFELKEKNLPEYLLHDIEEYKKYKDDPNCNFVDCLENEIYGSINMALINDRVITEEFAQYLRKKYLNM